MIKVGSLAPGVVGQKLLRGPIRMFLPVMRPYLPANQTAASRQGDAFQPSLYYRGTVIKRMS